MFKRTILLAAVALGTASLLAAEEPVDNKGWESSAGFGLTLTKGNSDTLLMNANVQSTRKWDKNEINLGADGTYGEAEDPDTGENDQTAGSVRGYAQYNRLFTERLFGYFRVDALHDSIADVDYRIGLSPGAGYYFIKNERTSLRGEVGPGVIFEKQGGETDTYMTLRLAERFDHKLNARARIWQTLEFLPQIDDWDNFIINAEIGIETDITKSLALKVYLQDTYDNQPAPGRDENDLKLVAGISYKF